MDASAAAVTISIQMPTEEEFDFDVGTLEVNGVIPADAFFEGYAFIGKRKVFCPRSGGFETPPTWQRLPRQVPYFPLASMKGY